MRKQVATLLLRVSAFVFGWQTLVPCALAADVPDIHSDARRTGYAWSVTSEGERPGEPMEEESSFGDTRDDRDSRNWPGWTPDVFIKREKTPASLDKVSVGDDIATVNATLGAPYRTIDDASRWYFYGAYDAFVMVRFEGNVATAVYSTNDTDGGAGVTLYTDKNDGGRVYAASVGVIGDAGVAATEQIIFELTNAFRARYGLPALVWSDLLGAAARAHSKEGMADRNFFGHVSPDGTTPGDRLTAIGYRWKICGENINAGYLNGVRAMDNWINSAGHRDNLLNTVGTELGVGWALGGVSGGYATYGTQNFGARR